MHAGIANLEFLEKSATVPKYALLIVDLFLSKVYVYPMQSRKQLLKYILCWNKKWEKYAAKYEAADRQWISTS